MDQKQIEKDVQEIIEICKDGVAGYETAAENIEYNDLKTLFLRLAQQRKMFIEDIKGEAIKLGIEPDSNGTVKGFFHRTWMNTKASLSNSMNKKVIEESMTGEKTAVEKYDKVLSDPELPAYLNDLLSEQQHLIKIAINQLSDLQKEINE